MRPDASHTNLGYRPEIDGLRALAVLPVILFHAGFDVFKGGFVGVDVFFVISGYLITSIIATDCRNGTFSLLTFYERRARRILPALFVVIIACLPFAWAWMLPAETAPFARSVLATIAFVPNVYFWRTTSYFGTAAEELPLLHTWSLGVEEQFYVVFPLLLWALWRFGMRAVVVAVTVLAVFSFGLSEWAWRSGRLSSSFFLAPTRAWELMLGALLALAWQRGPIYQRLGAVASNLGAVAGVSMLAYAVFSFESTTPTPSVYALWPTLGTVLIIACAGPGTLVHRLLASPPLVGIGLISYSAYLWHQPLFAFARLHSAQALSATALGAICLLALALAYLTWRFVENPFRRARVVSKPALVLSTSVCWAALLGVSLIANATQGFAGRIAPADAPLAALSDSETQGRYVAARFISLEQDFSSTRAGLRVLVVGDSYAEDFVNAMAESGNLAAAEVRTVSIVADCQPYFGTRDVSAHIEPGFRPICARDRVQASTQLRRRAATADVLVFASSWRPWSARLLTETLAEFAPTPTRKVFVVGPKRTGEVNIRELLQVPSAERAEVSQPAWPGVVEMEQLLTRIVPASQYVSMQAAICGGGPRCNLFTPTGELISFDGTHLTRAGAAYAGRNLFAMPPLAGLVARAP